MASSSRLLVDQMLGSHCYAGVWGPTCGSHVMGTGGFGGWGHRGGAGKRLPKGGVCAFVPAGDGRGEDCVWQRGWEVAQG